MSAADTLAAIIRREGAVTFDVFMDVALYDAETGSSAAGTVPAARAGLRHRARGRTAVRRVRRARARRLVARPRRARSVPRRRGRCRLGPAGARDPAGRARTASRPCATCWSNGRRRCARSSASVLPLEPADEALGPFVHRDVDEELVPVRGAGPVFASVADLPGAAVRQRRPRQRAARQPRRSGSPHWDGTRLAGSAHRRRTVPSSARCSSPPPMPMPRAATRRRRACGADRCPPPDTARDRGLARRVRRRAARAGSSWCSTTSSTSTRCCDAG